MNLDSQILTIVTFMPAIGALLILLFNGRQGRPAAVRGIALAVAVLTFVFSLHLIAHFERSTSDFQFRIDVPWIPAIGVNYSMGIDGISLFLILLTTVLTPLAILASWSITERAKEYFVFMLLLETGMVGVFASLDLFL